MNTFLKPPKSLEYLKPPKPHSSQVGDSVIPTDLLKKIQKLEECDIKELSIGLFQKKVVTGFPFSRTGGAVE
jgi:hypothetical protein